MVLMHVKNSCFLYLPAFSVLRGRTLLDFIKYKYKYKFESENNQLSFQGPFQCHLYLFFLVKYFF